MDTKQQAELLAQRFYNYHHLPLPVIRRGVVATRKSGLHDSTFNSILISLWTLLDKVLINIIIGFNQEAAETKHSSGLSISEQ